MPADVMRTLSHCLHDYLPFGYFVACSKFSTRLHLPTNASRQPSVVREIQKVVLIMYFLLSLLRWPDVDVELRDCPVFIRRVSPCVAMRLSGICSRKLPTVSSALIRGALKQQVFDH
jgi:hypothetical protein